MKTALYYTPLVLLILATMLITFGCPQSNQPDRAEDPLPHPFVYLWVDDGVGYWTRIGMYKAKKGDIVAVPCWQVVRARDDKGNFEPVKDTLAKAEKLPQLIPEDWLRKQRNK